MKAGPPGWEPHKILTRIDGWVVVPKTPDRIPTAVADMIARAMPQPRGCGYSVEDVRARMRARQRMLDRMSKDIDDYNE